MKLENQVCDLQLAMRLNELGVKQESLFVWEYWDEKAYAVKYYPYASVPNKILAGGVQLYSAFTVAELLNLLPHALTVPNGTPHEYFRLFITNFYTVDENLKRTRNFIVNYECDSTDAAGIDAWLRRKLTNNIFDPNPANALARMFIYLIENGIYMPCSND